MRYPQCLRKFCTLMVIQSWFRENVLSTPWLANIQPVRAIMTGTGDTSFVIEGFIGLTVKFCGHKATTDFVVASKVPTKMIPRTA